VQLDDSELDRIVAGVPPLQAEDKPIDLTDPKQALAADPAHLRVLSDEDKALLRFNITTFRRDLRPRFSQKQRWAFNADATSIPFRDDSTNGGPSTYHVTRSETATGTRVHLSGAAKDRWYVIVKGVGFSGVARGVRSYISAVSGVPHAFGSKAPSKAEAESMWLEYHATGQTQVLDAPKNPQPPVPSTVPAANTAPVRRARTAPTHVLDLESDDDSIVSSEGLSAMEIASREIYHCRVPSSRSVPIDLTCEVPDSEMEDESM
jgi:hypothetical protein